MKKGNTAAAWLLIPILLGHLGTMSYSMLTGWYRYGVCKALAYASAALTAVHVGLSLLILFFKNDGADLGRYKKMKLRVILQRASALGILALLHLHVGAFDFIAAGSALSRLQKLGILLTELLFFAAIFVHLGVSVGRSPITFGLLREKEQLRRADRITFVICAVLMLLTTAALTGFVVTWTGHAGG